ncbi:hypothetical protein Cfor_01822 [Coptotermes formosanus]|uniref:DEUBAD domain-containing protein n=1 Tax=Coptotermes formosanus TaxID=36987 RepID=A0A6L2PLA9_COPFO|nr:hypothetical protein Cfor_01822 [Coptotermes formosanus]
MEMVEDSHRNYHDINEACKNHDNVECGLADHRMDTMPGCSYDSLKDLNSRISHSHSKKVIKHALRQQAKRRRKNTTIASGNSAPLPRIVVKSLSVRLEDKEFKDTSNSASPKPATMREVLASIPGFSIKPRKRSTKKLSTAAQLEQTKEGCIDLETPDSILVNTNLRALLNKHTFSSLPPLYQYKLVQLLPDVDRAGVAGQPDASFRLSTSGLNNEFFARACLEWRERLAEGEFTPENQQKLKAEAEKEMSRLDPWKLKHFEPIWGEKHEPTSDSTPLLLPSPARPSLKTTIKLRPSTSASIRHSKIVPRRPRTVGAVTRAITNYWVKEEADSTADKPPSPTEKRPADQSDRIGEGKEMHKKLKAVSSSAEESSTDVGMLHSVNTEECVSGNGISSERAENSVGDEALAYETDVTVYKSEKDIEASAAESSVNCESEQMAARETVAHETDAAECKSEEHVTPESAECEMSIVTCTVKEENIGIDKETEDVHVTSEVDTSMKCESKKQQGESGNRDSAERNIDMKLHYDNPSDIRPVLSNVEVLLKCETEVAATEIDSVVSNVRNTVDQDLDLVQEMTVSDGDHITYEPDVPGHDVIHESAMLDSSGYIVSGDSVVQTNSNSKEGDTKTAVDVSGEVESVSGLEDLKVEEDEDAAEVHAAALIAAVTGTEGCCWDVDSTEKLLDKVPLTDVPLVAVPVTLAVVEERDVEVIPMQEELEVILKPSTFPMAPEDALSMDSAIVTAALDDIGDGTSSTVKSTQAQYPEYSTSQAVKLELEVTLTPEAVTSADSLVTSTVGGSQHNTAASSAPPAVSKTNVATVIPPTTIVCLPSAVSAPSFMNHTQLSSCLNAPTSSSVVSSSLTKTAAVASSSAVPYLALSSNTPVRALPTHLPKSQAKAKQRDSSQVSSGGSGGGSRGSRGSSNKPPPGAVNLERSYQICQAVIQNSPNRDQLRCQLKPPPSLLAANASSCGSNNKKSESSVPPHPATQYGIVTSSRNGSGPPNNSVSGKPFTPPLPAPGGYPMVPGSNGLSVAKPVTSLGGQGKVTSSRGGTYHQRQQSPPVVVRHVFTSSQGIPVTMAVLPQSQAPPEVAESAGAQLGHVGQYILVQHTGVGDQPETVQVMLNSGQKGAPPPPRASSAPPSNNQVSGGGRLGLGRGRPASVDVERSQLVAAASQQQHGVGYVTKRYGEHFVVQCPNLGTQAITRKDRSGDSGNCVQYGDVGSGSTGQSYTVGDIAIMEQSVTNSYTQQPVVLQGGGRVAARQTHNNHISVSRTDPSQCGCNLKAMIMCKKCGAFCHDDCIGPSRLCVTCLIR